MQELASEVTSLEDQIHHYGSVTVKQPDVWGDADLMGYIQEYEQVMINRLGDFKDTIQGYIARSDQADMQSMTSLGLNLGPSTAAIPTPFSAYAASGAVNGAATPTAVSTTSSSGAPQGQVFDVLNQALSNPNATPSAKFSLEPTESLRQNSTYLKVNQGLRRINSGADTAQAAGYGLYLLRVPVSILPGRKTRQGYSAVVTMRAQMVIDPDHLRVTFPKLVFGDLADQLLRTYADHWKDDDLPNDSSKALCTPTTRIRPPRLNATLRSATLTLANPVTSQQFDDLYGYDEMNCLFKTVKGNLTQIGKSSGGNPPRDELRKWLVSYFNRMYDELKERQLLSGSAYDYIPQTGAAYARGDKASLATMRAGWERSAGPGSELASAGWMVMAQAAVLDRQLKDTLKDMKRAGHLPLAGDDSLIEGAQFANTAPPHETRTQELWSAFVQNQYPMHVFELDPNIEEQNIYDAFSQRRELQLALAFAVANGNLRADQAIKYTRQMALDMTTIDLNRTQVGFAHENDTFGWYFYPRVQAMDPEHSNLGSCLKTMFCGGFTRDDELCQRRLEPGIRECEVLVVMPNFVPELKLDITTNWEKLTRPGKSKLDYNEMIELGAQVECVKHRAMNVCDAERYRPGDYERLVSRVEQLEKMLPLQTFSVTVPYQYDLPGAQLFDKGAASLEPEITGYYGLSYIKRGSPTVAQFFLTGHHFHPTRTRVIIGGTEVHSTVQVLQFTAVPAAGQTAQTAGQTVATTVGSKSSGSASPPASPASSTASGLTSDSRPSDGEIMQAAYATESTAGSTKGTSKPTGSGGSTTGGSSGGGSSGSGSSGGGSGGGGSSGGGSSGGTPTGGNGSGVTPGSPSVQTVSAAQTAPANGYTVQWTTQQVEVINRDLLRITVSLISPELSAGPIPVRVATPAGLSNEFEIDPAPSDTPAGVPFSLVNPVITFPFAVNSTKTAVVVNAVSGTTGFELKWAAPAGASLIDVQVKLTVPSTNATTTVAYKLSDNTGADAIDSWLQAQCAAVLNRTVDLANPSATPSPIAVNVTISAAAAATGSAPTDVALPTALQLQPKLLTTAGTSPVQPSPVPPSVVPTPPQPGAPVSSTPVPTTPVPTAPMSAASASSTSAPDLPLAPVPSASAPAAPVPSAPVSSTPVPSAAVPSTSAPSAPVSTSTEPAAAASSTAASSTPASSVSASSATGRSSRVRSTPVPAPVFEPSPATP
jgi:hypothetical protein